jgi:hypothetical protein
LIKQNRWKELFEHEYSLYHKNNDKEYVLNVNITKNKEVSTSQEVIDQILETTEQYCYV